MNNRLSYLVICICLVAMPSQLLAETEPYYATGEDIDNLMDEDNTSVLIGIEEKLSEFSLFRKLEEYFHNINYDSDSHDDLSQEIDD